MKKLKLENKRAILLIAVAVAVVALVSISYAYFTTAGEHKPVGADLGTATLALRFADNDNGINAQLGFGETITKKFLIENTGTAEASLSLDWKNLINTYMNGSLTYTMTYSETEDGEYKELLPPSNVPVSSNPLRQTMAGEISVPAGETYYYNLNITLNNTDKDQSQDLEAVLNTVFDVGQPLKYRYYTLSVNPNGGVWDEFSSTQEYLLKNGETKTINTPSRVGHTFEGWTLNGVSSTLEDGLFKMGISDASLEARWKANSYSVTIDPAGGSYDDETEFDMEYGTNVTLANPTKTGYTFDGWSVSGGSIDGNTFTLTEDKDVTITANWSVNSYTYTVTHRQMNVDGNGYTVVSADTITARANYGEKITPKVNTYEGFTSPSSKEITISTNESLNSVTYDYTRNRYDITINANGGTYSGETQIEDAYYGSTINIPNPSKEGHTFTNWTVSKGTLSGTTYTVGAGDATLTANYTVNNYKYIVYHRQMNVNGSGYTTVDADTDEGESAFGSIVTPGVKTYTGFTSPGTKSMTIQVDSNPPVKNVLDYQYPRNKYNLTVNPNGGTYDGKTTNTVIEMYYGSNTTLGTPTREGYTFDGWTNTGGTLTGSTFTMSGAANATVTAKWKINSYQYKVYHRQMNVNGSGYTIVSADTVTASANYGTTITPEVKTYTGFTSPDTRSMTISTNTSNNEITYDYVRNQYTLTINPNGGSYEGKTTDTTVNVYYGATYTLSTPTKTGYNYSWSKASGAGSLSGSVYTMGAGDATVKANWTAKTFSVTFNANGGTTPTASKTVTYDSTYGELPTPTYEGYEFLGWFTAQEGGNQILSTTKVALSSNQTLFAHWKKINPAAPLLAKANDPSITDYNAGNKKEMFAFDHDELTTTTTDNYGTYTHSATQVADWTSEERRDYRYIGANPNNYITFNDEIWRIIGVFTVENESGNKEQLIKIMRDQSIGDMPWNSSDSNEWSTASLQKLLNGDYYNRVGSYSTNGLNSTARSQIAKVKWYLGGSSEISTLRGPDYYNFERGTTVYSGRTTSIMQNVGLMYPSDYVYTYANGVNDKCYTDGYNCNQGTPSAGWLYNGDYQWTISPNAADADYAFHVHNAGCVGSTSFVDATGYVSSTLGVRPTVYLDSKIAIKSGDGSQGNPYTIG